MNLLSVIFEGIDKRAFEVFLALSPVIITIFLLILGGLKVHKDELKRMLFGFAVTYLGLVLLLHGVHIAFIPVGHELGMSIAAYKYREVLIPIGFVLGFIVAFAEPAVHVLNHQVEDMSAGSIKSRPLLIAISVGVATAVTLAMLRHLFGFSLWYLLLPGYVIIFAFSKFVDPTYVAIAFDSGGVATGPMCATFLLSFSIGVSEEINETPTLADGLGLVALVAMAPIFSIMLMSFLFNRSKKKNAAKLEKTDNTSVGNSVGVVESSVSVVEDKDEDDIIINVTEVKTDEAN